jgi:membrane protease YdiL (CAAX protease family)
MEFIKGLFWNEDQTRLRSVFRLLIQATVFFILMKGLAALTGVPDEITAYLPLWTILVLAGIRLFRVLISVWLTGRFIDRRSFSDFGLQINKEWWGELGFGLVLGIFLISLVFLVELTAGWITITDTFFTVHSDGSFFITFIVYLVLFACVGFSEELMYRGYFLTNLAEGFNGKSIGPKYALILGMVFSSLLFGIFHLGSLHATFISTLNIVVFGLLFGLSYGLTGRIAIAIGMHTTWNLFQGNVFGLPVSGEIFPLESAAVFSIQQNGPALWTGGAFGPEAGLVGLITFVIGFLILLGWVRFRQGSLKLNTQISQPPSNEKSPTE